MTVMRQRSWEFASGSLTIRQRRKEHYRKRSGRFGKGQPLIRSEADHLKVGFSKLHAVRRLIFIASTYRKWITSEQRLGWKMNTPCAYSMVVTDNQSFILRNYKRRDR